MFTEIELKEAAHPLVMHVLKVERTKRGSLKAAQEYVAHKMGGFSPRSLRRLTGRSATGALHAHHLLNLVQLYLERRGDSGPIKRLWRRVLKAQPHVAKIRTSLSARFFRSEKSSVA